MNSMRFKFQKWCGKATSKHLQALQKDVAKNQERSEQEVLVSNRDKHTARRYTKMIQNACYTGEVTTHKYGSSVTFSIAIAV